MFKAALWSRSRDTPQSHETQRSERLRCSKRTPQPEQVLAEEHPERLVEIGDDDLKDVAVDVGGVGAGVLLDLDLAELLFFLTEMPWSP
jgi:hypothetical protein